MASMAMPTQASLSGTAVSPAANPAFQISGRPMIPAELLASS